ncbi:Broad specificity phosphatase PhoE [Roseovarius nanhaiticus]|uniref:Broad specificity phosphatase PhoE n=1 Tax=Roseovarius nanhaiticus TaxID=573024 RepID=A0A1N7EG32_9RHOB|nr:histidine phosphatase family protein [Roseovarius nanhaiticus]SEK75186.1 Broad specificity phosphatase PhoE [Roseovarius nanhaiticus]SIR87113.1 Broad specificity phosphatase PhoE [Roseovarius nanhaiticus]
MTEIILIRHGQANSGASDEAGYDRLSDLGHRQAAWLGEWLQSTDPHFDRVITGTLTRQRQTAHSMGFAATGEDARLNELTYFALAQAMEAQHGVAAPDTAQEFSHYMPQVIAHWAEDRLADVPETFGSFHTRITTMIDEIASQHGRSMLVTSGGVIGMIMRHVLGLDTHSMTRMMLRTHNSSVHRLRHVHGQLVLDSFNATPHLDAKDRAHARTFI